MSIEWSVPSSRAEPVPNGGRLEGGNSGRAGGGDGGEGGGGAGVGEGGGEEGGGGLGENGGLRGFVEASTQEPHSEQKACALRVLQ